MANEDYYDNEPSSPPAEESGKESKDEGIEKTALLPKTFFSESDLEVGYRCEVEITAIHDEDVSVRMTGENEADESESEPPPNPERMMGGGGGGRMSEMME